MTAQPEEGMVEQIARLFEKAILDAINGGVVDTEKSAREAIEAMREPTDLMKKLGGGYFIGMMPDDAANIWRTMVDAALSSNEKGRA